jgi:hypothetical protein
MCSAPREQRKTCERGVSLSTVELGKEAGGIVELVTLWEAVVPRDGAHRVSTWIVDSALNALTPLFQGKCLLVLG